MSNKIYEEYLCSQQFFHFYNVHRMYLVIVRVVLPLKYWLNLRLIDISEVSECHDWIFKLNVIVAAVAIAVVAIAVVASVVVIIQFAFK